MTCRRYVTYHSLLRDSYFFIARDSSISTQDGTGTNTLHKTRHSELKHVSFEVILSAEILNLSYFPTMLYYNVLKSFPFYFLSYFVEPLFLLFS